MPYPFPDRFRPMMDEYIPKSGKEAEPEAAKHVDTKELGFDVSREYLKKVPFSGSAEDIIGSLMEVRLEEDGKIKPGDENLVLVPGKFAVQQAILMVAEKDVTVEFSLEDILAKFHKVYPPQEKKAKGSKLEKAAQAMVGEVKATAEDITTAFKKVTRRGN